MELYFVTFRWGGCIVALVPVNKVEEYKLKMKKDFFVPKGIHVKNWNNVVFSTKPAEGASIYVP